MTDLVVEGNSNDQIRRVYVAALVSFKNAIGALLEAWPSSNAAASDKLSEKFPFDYALEEEAHSILLWVEGVRRNFHVEGVSIPFGQPPVFGGSMEEAVEEIGNIARAASRLSEVWDRLSSEDQNTVAVGYPFKKSFNDVALAILDWWESVR